MIVTFIQENMAHLKSCGIFFLTNRIKITSGQQGLPVTVELVFCPRVLGEEDNGDRIQPVLL